MTKKEAKRIINVLEKKALDGCTKKSWKGFENGNGIEFGSEVDSLISYAKKVLSK